jgi:ABC-type dipeptide/oligopeptide/nickel transport system permease component
MVPIFDRSRAQLLIKLLKRFLTGILTALAAVTLVFLILRMVGTDPVDSLLAQGLATADQAMALRQRLGLDRPFYLQYLDYLINLLKGDLGVSLYTQRPVLQTILEQFRWTASLALTALIIGVAFGFTLGSLAAWRNGTFLGNISASIASILTALPVAVAGVLALLLSTRLGLGGASLLLPALVLGLTISGPIARLSYAQLYESIHSPYIIAARSRGIPRGSRLLWHAMRPILPPLLSLIALEAAFLFTGTVVTETIFSRPGLGRLMVRSILEGDFPITQGLVVVAAVIYTASHVISDWMAILSDPRLRRT